MGRPFDPAAGLLAKCEINMSHQEMDRLVTELQAIWDSFTQDGYGQGTGIEWLPVDGVADALGKELGYEDMGEFEDALQGSFVDFLHKLPNIDTKVEDRGNGPRTFFRIPPDPPREEWRSVRMTLRIASPRDLWRVCLKSPHARIEIPELEFEISADGKRHIDSLYNHIGAAVFNLSMYVRQSSTGLSDDHKERIMETVLALNEMLDVPRPFTWVLHDPSGLSEFKPLEGVDIEWGPEEATEAAAEDGKPPEQQSDQQQQPQDARQEEQQREEQPAQAPPGGDTQDLALNDVD